MGPAENQTRFPSPSRLPAIDTDWTRISRMDKARLCVLCGKQRQDERWRPFCSERCRNEDLARWADGRYRIAGEPVPGTDQDAESDADD
jgi:endogenous inhibitor of DNA gyrase (YacG/DUF329 family)